MIVSRATANRATARVAPTFHVNFDRPGQQGDRKGRPYISREL